MFLKRYFTGLVFPPTRFNLLGKIKTLSQSQAENVTCYKTEWIYRKHFPSELLSHKRDKVLIRLHETTDIT